MQTHEGIEHQQARLHLGDRLVEASAVGFEIEPHDGSGDDLDVEIAKREACGSADAVEPSTHGVERILGGVEQHASGARYLEAAQTWRAGGDRDGEVEGEEGFATFGLAT